MISIDFIKHNVGNIFIVLLLGWMLWKRVLAPRMLGVKSMAQRRFAGAHRLLTCMIYKCCPALAGSFVRTVPFLSRPYHGYGLLPQNPLRTKARRNHHGDS